MMMMTVLRVITDVSDGGMVARSGGSSAYEEKASNRYVS